MTRWLGKGECVQLPVVWFFTELLLFFRGVIDGSASFHWQDSVSESQSILRLGFGVCCPPLRATFLTGFFVANPVRGAVEAPKTSYYINLKCAGRLEFFFWSCSPLLTLAPELLSCFATVFFMPFFCCISLDISFCFSNSWTSKRLVDMWDWI